MLIKTPILKTLTIITLGALPLAALTPAANAHTTKQIERAQERQHDRIEHGRRTGKITYTEGIKLRREQRRINALKATLKRNDGRLDRAERHVIRKLQRDASRNIRSEARDSRKRWRILPRVGR